VRDDGTDSRSISTLRGSGATGQKVVDDQLRFFTVIETVGMLG